MARRPLSRWLGGTLLCGSLGACFWGCVVSLGGLSGGDDHPGADSAVLDHDASTDAKAPPADGTSPQDVALATDGESSADTGDDTRPEDSGKKKGDAGCVPLVFDGGSALSCAGSDASTCSPQNLGNYKPVWVPPRAPAVRVHVVADLHLRDGLHRR